MHASCPDACMLLFTALTQGLSAGEKEQRQQQWEMLRKQKWEMKAQVGDPTRPGLPMPAGRWREILRKQKWEMRPQRVNCVHGCSLPAHLCYIERGEMLHQQN